MQSGEEAIEWSRVNSADLVILDMIMHPGLDGFETFKQIVTLHPGQRAVIASRFAEEERVKKALRLGMHSFIRKPYTLKNFGLAVKEALRSN